MPEPVEPTSAPAPNPEPDPERWLAQYGDLLYRFALSRLHDAELAQDAVQETLLAALKARERFSGRSAEKSWLLGILRHKVIDFIRKKVRERPVSELVGGAEDPHRDGGTDGEDKVIDGFFDRIGHWRTDAAPREWDSDPRSSLQKKEFWRVLQDCLGSLPERIAQVFVLREIEHIETEEICKAVGISPTNYWVMMHRARGRLRACLEENWFGEAKRKKK